MAWLYRQLYRAAQASAHEIGGAATLLQVCALNRFPYIAPRRESTKPFVPRVPLAYRWNIEQDTTYHATHVVQAFRDAFDQQSIG